MKILLISPASRTSLVEVEVPLEDFHKTREGLEPKKAIVFPEAEYMSVASHIQVQATSIWERIFLGAPIVYARKSITLYLLQIDGRTPFFIPYGRSWVGRVVRYFWFLRKNSLTS